MTQLSRHKFSSLLLAATLAVAGTAAKATEVAYTLDPTHTQVIFDWNHFGLSNPAASFHSVSGTLLWNDAEPNKSSVQVSMPVASLNTQVPLLDSEFKSAKYFDMERYPNVSFKSIQVERIGVSNRFKVTGDLTVRGVTKPVVLDAVMNGAVQHPSLKAPALGFDATATFNRSDFGLTEALPMVSDEIRVRITAEAVEAKSYEKAMKALAGR